MNCLVCDDTRAPRCPAESGPTAALLTGTVGVGKTTTAEAVGSQLAKAGGYFINRLVAVFAAASPFDGTCDRCG